ncbi:MAG: hypothetical protein J4469_04820 [Candidatus Aenigmarchaeota archaeon]|nr:hypothetical protein [Candidatus Aenigmarchaeota archaeon]
MLDVKKITTYTFQGETNAACIECGRTDIGARYKKTITTRVDGQTKTMEAYSVDQKCKDGSIS